MRLLRLAFSRPSLAGLRAPALALALLPLAACSNNGGGAGTDASNDQATVLLGFDAPAAADAHTDAEVLRTSLRIALLAPLGYGIDVCVRESAGSMVYSGPLLYQQLPSLADAGVDGAKKDAHSSHLDAREDGHDEEAGVERDGGEDASTPHDAAIDAREGLDARDDGDDAKDAQGAGRADGAKDAHGEGPADGAKDGPTDGASEPEDAPTDAPRDAPHEAPRDAPSDAPPEGHDDGSSHDVDGAPDGASDASSQPDGGERVGGVLYQEVSHYLTVAGGGTFDVAIVLGGSSTCNQKLAIQRVTLDPGKLSTLVVESVALPAVDASTPDASPPRDASRDDARPTDATSGVDATQRDATIDATKIVDAARSVDAGRRDGSELKDATSDGGLDGATAAVPLAIIVLTDEPALSTTLARARFFNAISATPDAGAPFAVRLSAVEQSLEVPLAVYVPPGSVSQEHPTSPAVDSLGYWEGAPLAATTPVSLHVTSLASFTDAGHDAGHVAPSWTFGSTTSFDLTQARSNHTGFLVGGVGQGLTLVWCDDTSSTNQTLTSCVSVAAE